jgi:phage-related baseplate assembly protein
LWIADIIIQERVIIDTAAKQNVPRYAEGVFLDSLAEIFKDTERLQPAPARTTLRFYISAAQPSAQTIPKGTRATVDGVITFETEESTTVSAGALYADAPAVCISTELNAAGEKVTIGAAGNGFTPGQIAQIVDVYPYYERVENTTTSEGGSDAETDEAFYVRLSESMESFSTAGPLGAYIYWTKTASALITDVKPTSPEPGIADIRVLLEGGQMPDAEMIQLIYDTINEEKTRPFTDFVQVSAPDPIPYDIDITYYIPAPRMNGAALIQADVAKAVTEYKRWQSEKMGRDLNPDELTQRIKQAGAKRVVIRSPAFTVVQDTAVAILNNETVVYGGIEDE